MKNCKHYTLDCEQEKMGCKGCAYEKDIKTVDGMFKELGYTEHTIYEEDDTEIYNTENSRPFKFIGFDNKNKRIAIMGTINKDILKAINKKVEELEW